jgi:O-antigen/teichoic acid export membrane protein
VNDRRLSAGGLSSLAMAIVLACCVVGLVIHHDGAAAGWAVLSVALWLLFCLFPMSFVDRSMPAPATLARSVLAEAVLVGVVALVAPLSTGVATLTAAASVILGLLVLLVLMRVRRGSEWRAAPRGAIGFFADGRGDQDVR